MIRWRFLFTFGLVGLGFFYFIPVLYAADVTVRPILIDHTVAPRDVITETVTVTNITNSKLNIYATVNEISLDADGSIKAYLPPGERGDADTILDWLAFTRGRTELMPGDVAEIPITINIPPDAQPGNYQAFIGFSAASKRYQAESKALAGEAMGVVVRLVIPDQRVEGVRIVRFAIDRFVTSDQGHEAVVTLENVGETSAVPLGDIVFYNSRSEEVATISLNSDQGALAPGETITFTEPVPLTSGLGRYKANLRLTYGSLQRAQLMDTSFFYIFPWQTVLLFFIASIVIVLTLILSLRRHASIDYEKEDGIDVPLYVADRAEHTTYDHDINLKG